MAMIRFSPPESLWELPLLVVPRQLLNTRQPFLLFFSHQPHNFSVQRLYHHIHWIKQLIIWVLKYDSYVPVSV